MNTQAERQSQNKSVKTVPNHNADVDFETWAAAVKQQMIAALRKRGGS